MVNIPIWFLWRRGSVKDAATEDVDAAMEDSNLRSFHQLRVRRLRAKALVCAGTVVLLAFFAVVLGVVAPSLTNTLAAKRHVDAPFLLFQLSSFLSSERDVSVTFVQNVNFNNTARQEAAIMRSLQAYTRELLVGALQNAEVGRDGVRLGNLGYGMLMGLQSEVLWRSIPPSMLFDTFRSIMMQVVASVSQFAAEAQRPTDSGTYGTYVASRINLVHAGTLAVLKDVLAIGSLNDALLTRTSILLVKSAVVQGQLEVLLQYMSFGSAHDDLALALSRSQSVLNTLLASAVKSGDWNLVVDSNGPHSPYQFLKTVFRQRVNQFIFREKALHPWADAQVIVYIIVTALAAVALVLSALTATLTVFSVCKDLLTAEATSSEIRNVLRVEQSLRRMETFIDALSRMDTEAAAAAISDVPAGAVMQSEREIYTLRHTVELMMSFVHPCILARRGASSATLTTPGLAYHEVTLILVDLEQLHVMMTNESSKTVPKLFNEVLMIISQAISGSGGVVAEISGTRLIAGWNLNGETYDCENTACHAVEMLYRCLVESRGLNVSFAIVSGSCHVGVIGDGEMQSFVVLGPLIPLGSMLLKLNRLHGTRAIVDTRTFHKVDGLQYRRRPLEVVAVDETTVPTTAFELVLESSWSSGKQMSLTGWNEAFDEYQSRHFDAAERLLRNWQLLHGATPSSQRLMGLMKEHPPRACTYWRCFTSNVELELMF